MGRREARMWPGVVLAVMLALFAFILSFDALRVVGLACGIQPSLAWMFPLIVDGSTLAFTWAAWAFRTRRMGTAYPWLMLVLFSAISLVGNALHAHPVQVNGLLLPDWATAMIMTVPPVALLATTHMIVLAASRTLTRLEETPETEPEPPATSLEEPEPIPGPEPEPDSKPEPEGMPLPDLPAPTPERRPTGLDQAWGDALHRH